MIKSIYKCYLRFPSAARTLIDFSFKGFMGVSGMEYYHPSPEHILLECDDLFKIKNN